MTASIREDKSRSGEESIAEKQPPGVATELLFELQCSLDIEVLTDIIREQLSRMIPMDALLYVNEEESLRILSGTAATHSCGYRLVTRTENLGELVFQRNHSFRDEELQRIESLLPLLLAPLRNGLQFRRAVHASLSDPVSGARNRKHLDSLLPREIELAKRHNRPLSGLMIEIGELDQLHRQLGHTQADALTRQLVQRIMGISRDTDLLFQLDSETLFLLLHETGRTAAKGMAERIRHHCQTSFELTDGSFQISVSMGLVCLTGTDNQKSLLDRGFHQLKQSRQLAPGTICD